MKRIFIPVFVVFFLLPVLVNAETYYVDATGGSDSNSGTSPSSAWQNISKVNEWDFNPGDSILFKRGGIWREQLNVPNSGNSSNYITFGAYGSGDKPLITASESHTSGWTLYSGNTWYKGGFSSNPKGAWLDGVSYEKAADKDSITSTDRYFWEDSTDRVYVYATSNPSSYYSTIEICVRAYSCRIQDKNYLKFDGLHFRDGHGGTFYGHGSSSYIEVVNCDITRGGPHSVYLYQNANNFIFDNCRIDNGNRGNYNNVITVAVSTVGNCTIRNSTVSRGMHAGLMLGHTSNWLVENNEFWSEEGFGRNIAIHGNLGEGFHTIRYNYFHDAHWGNGICLGPDQFCGEGTKLYYNIFANAEYRGFNLWGSSSGFPVKDYKIYNNVIYGAGDYGIRISTGNSGNEIKNNLIFGNDPSTHYQIYFWNINVIPAYTFENNTIYDSSTSDTIYDGSTIRTVSWMDQNYPEWKNNIALDPKLFDAPNGDFRLQADSPCIDNGTDVDLTLDFEGNSVPYGPLPDIGAYEYSPPTNCTGICKPNECNTYDNCTNASGTCLPGQFCCSGTCTFCGDEDCDFPIENCSSCPQDCDCSPQLCCDGVCTTPACSQNSDCGTDPCKNYTCSNPGTCQASCSYQDITSCTDNDNCCPAGCDEGDDNDCVALEGPVALYHFDENLGSIAIDSSGYGNDGTINGANWTNDSVSGYALEFDGVNDYVSIPEDDSLDMGTSDFTVSLWVKTPDTGNFEFLFAKDGQGNEYQLIKRTNGRLRVDINDGTTYVGSTDDGDAFDDNQWHHIAVLFNRDSDMTRYMDGSVNGSTDDITSVGDVSSDSTSYIGSYEGSSSFFNGKIDEVRIYNRALTPEEILELYDQGTGNYSEADLNNDGDVDIFDLDIVAIHFGQTESHPNWEETADVVDNNEIDIFDVVFVASRFT